MPASKERQYFEAICLIVPTIAEKASKMKIKNCFLYSAIDILSKSLVESYCSLSYLVLFFTAMGSLSFCSYPETHFSCLHN
jgi:hypothetical protein